MRQSIISISVFSLTLLLVGCGQMGPLYLPSAKDNAKIAAKSTPVDKVPADDVINKKPVDLVQKLDDKAHQPDPVVSSTLKSPKSLVA